MSNTVVFKDRELSEVTVIENEFIKSFLADMPALPLKVYIYGLMLLSGASSADADLASALGCGDNDLRAAVSYLEGVGLVKVIADEPLQLKFNSAKEACGGNFAVGDTAYADLVNGIQKVAGTRIITGREIKKIYDWVEIFGFEKEAAVEIVRRCLDKKGARTSVNYMDSVAKDLAAAGALTREQVLERFADEDSLSNGVMELQRQMNRKGLPTKDEAALYEKWTKAWGFTQDVIFAACAETTKGRGASYSYIDSILERWHRDGAVSCEAVREMQRREDMVKEIARVAFDRAGLKTTAGVDQRNKIEDWVYGHAMSQELLYLAAEYSKDDVHPFVSMTKLMNEWRDKGVSAVSAAKAYYEAYQKGARGYTGQKKNPALNYMQGGAYTREELKKLGISFGEEFYSDDDD